MRSRLAQTFAILTILVGMGTVAPPAGANPHASTLYSGSADIDDAWGDPVGTLPLVGLTCTTPTSFLNVNGSSGAGVLTLDQYGDEAISFLGRDYRIEYEIELNGSYSGTSASGTGSVVIEATRAVSWCTPDSWGTCTIQITGLSFAGTLTGTLSGHSLSVSGSNPPAGDFGYEVTVSGTLSACGPLIAVDDGAIDPLDLVVTF